MSSIQGVTQINRGPIIQSEISSKSQFKSDLSKLKLYLDALHRDPSLLQSDKFQNSMYSFMEQFANDFNQLPEAERKSPQMEALIDDLVNYGLVNGNSNGISVSPNQSQFSSALDGLVMPSQTHIIPRVLDPAIDAAMRTL